MSAFFHNIFIYPTYVCAYVYVHTKFGRKGTKKLSITQIFWQKTEINFIFIGNSLCIPNICSNFVRKFGIACF